MEDKMNSHLVEEGKFYAKKKIIKTGKDHWYYRQTAILRKLGGHKNII